MKRTITIILVYALLIFAICMGATFAYRPLPVLVPEDVGSFRFVRGMRWFIEFIPSIFLSGFIVSCSVVWKGRDESCKKRFSPAMASRFGHVMGISIVLVALMIFCQEIFLPMFNLRYETLVGAPAELQEAKSKARTLLNTEQPELAYQHALRADMISHHDEESQELLRLAENAVDIAHDKALHYYDNDSSSERDLTADELKPLFAHDHNYKALELLKKSQEALEQKDWFTAHYWATLTIQASDGTDTSLQIAKKIATDAWNQMRVPVRKGNDELVDYYTRKMAAYEALQAGNVSDSLLAYYAFKELADEGHGEEPDIERFLGLAEEAVENEYFFIDETDNMANLERAHNIYFSLDDSVTGTTSIYFIKGVMDLRRDNHVIRYLDGLTVATFSKSGKFIRSMYAPVAKVISQPLSGFSDDALSSHGFSSDWKNIPLIMLQAVDRESKGLVVSPYYSYVNTNLPREILEKEGLVGAPLGSLDVEVPLEVQDQLRENVIHRLPEKRIIMLPMPYSDFITFDNASDGPSKMDLFSLFTFVRKAKRYGFSVEVFSKSLLGRGLYPLLLLSLMIFAASIGWNYRVEDMTNFKFRWIFLIPVFGGIIYLLMSVVNYLYDMVNYVLVGAFGGAAFIVAAVLYALLLFVMSLFFLARRD